MDETERRRREAVAIVDALAVLILFLWLLGAWETLRHPLRAARAAARAVRRELAAGWAGAWGFRLGLWWAQRRQRRADVAAAVARGDLSGLMLWPLTNCPECGQRDEVEVYVRGYADGSSTRDWYCRRCRNEWRMP